MSTLEYETIACCRLSVSRDARSVISRFKTREKEREKGRTGRASGQSRTAVFQPRLVRRRARGLRPWLRGEDARRGNPAPGPAATQARQRHLHNAIHLTVPTTKRAGARFKLPLSLSLFLVLHRVPSKAHEKKGRRIDPSEQSTERSCDPAQSMTSRATYGRPFAKWIDPAGCRNRVTSGRFICDVTT